ncbi:MAG: cell division protein FtsL [Myxococcales bacterium]|nr:cell division protein FtsL [Myxococcota bacterium]MDW8280522.1 cell division protein FtsL [Myxococcales bacterium]
MTDPSLPAYSPRLQRLHRALLRRLRQRSFIHAATLAVVLGVATALLHVSIRLQVLRIGYALSEETRVHHELVQQNQRLRLELATRKDPALVERIARERLRMSPPDPAAIRVLHRPATAGEGRP